jgi:hypothetical protein
VQIQLKKAKTIESLANFEPFKITLDDPTGISTTVATLSYLTIGAAFFATCCMINLICPSLFPWLIETTFDAIQKMCCCCIKSSRNVIERTFSQNVYDRTNRRRRADSESSFTFRDSSAPNPENSETAPFRPIVRFDNSADQNVQFESNYHQPSLMPSTSRSNYPLLDISEQSKQTESSNRLSKVIRTPSEIQLSEKSQWNIVKSKSRAQLRICVDETFYIFNPLTQQIVGQFGNINNEIEPPTPLMLAQLENEISSLMPPPLLVIAGDYCLESDANVILNQSGKFFFNRISNEKIHGYRVPDVLASKL